MEIPIQVAVQIYPGYPNEPRCVEAIPCIDTNSNNVANESESPHVATGLIRITSPDQSSDDKPSHTFNVQHALPYECTQESIYRKTVCPLVSMFLEGYDVSIVTYGQQGTGKTYTMYGPGLDCVFSESEQGIVQRAVRDIFMQLDKRQRHCNFVVNIAWIEICGNGIQDMFGTCTVNTVSEVFQCLKIGMANRNREASHSLFTITLEQRWVTSDGLIQHRLSTASFCDLYGVERTATNTNDFMTNDLGLRTLERIVCSLCSTNYCNSADNIQMNLMRQYDETTLTRLLKDSFGGRAQTLMILCVSPLERDIVETIQNLEFAYRVQFVRNVVVMNTFSDNNVPLAKIFGTPQSVMTAQVQPTLMPSVPQHPLISAALDKLNSNQKLSASSETALNVKYAAIQWLKLVSNAEGLFNKLLISDAGKQLNIQDRECIEEWMYLKHECEECLSSGELVPNPRLLGPIPETDETDEVSNCNEGFDGKDVLDSSILSDNESEVEDIVHLEEKVGELMDNFSSTLDTLIDEQDRKFLNKYPKAITNSIDRDNGTFMKTKRSSSVGLLSATKTATPNNKYNMSRRRSIQPGGSNSDALQLSSADLEHLQRVAKKSLSQNSAPSLNNTAFREAIEFLDSSAEMHPQRVAKMSRIQDELESCIWNISIKEKEIAQLKETIHIEEKVIVDMKKKRPEQDKAGSKSLEKDIKLREKYQKKLQQSRNARHEQRIAKLDKKIGATEQAAAEQKKNLDESQKLIESLKQQLRTVCEKLKNDRKLKESLEECLRQEKSKTIAIEERITQLDSVLEGKSNNLKLNSGENEKEQALRHEIRNLRRVREDLVNKRMSFRLKVDPNTSFDDSVREISKFESEIDFIDMKIELKNEAICDNDNKSLVHRHQQEVTSVGGAGMKVTSDVLNPKEMLKLLCRYEERIIDMRETNIQQEIQHGREKTEWKMHECSLYNAIQQSYLKGKRDALNYQREQQAQLAMVLQMAAEDSANISHNSSLLMSPHGANLLQMIEAKSKQHQRRQYVDNVGDTTTATNASNRLMAHQLVAVKNATATTVATAASSTCYTELNATNGTKSNKSPKNLFQKMFPAFIGQNSLTSPLPESHTVTRDKNKLIIQRNK